MTMNSIPAKAALGVLTVIGALVLLRAFGMVFMHSSMTAGSALHGLWLSMAGMCRVMIGS